MGQILNEFINILVGDLDNRAQVEEEKEKGQQIHPYAKHITRDCTHIVRHLPKNLEGRYILEESYYTYPDQEMIVKPLLFYIRQKENSVLLNSIGVPARLDPIDVINANKDLYFDYDEMIPKEAFGDAVYVYDPNENCFRVDHFCTLAPGFDFRLTERLSHEGLQVMETWTKDGVVTTPYTTPLIYIKFTSENI